jgi:DNA mismatch endonuclease (patch repair protein)
MTRRTDGRSFRGLKAASAHSRRAAQGSSKKSNTRCEMALRHALWSSGFRYLLFLRGVSGRPDIIFQRARVLVFCDGDFWHGRNLRARLARLSRGHNAVYWMNKIRTNVERDRATTALLRKEGWRVIRLWESDILRDPAAAAATVADALRSRHGSH